MFSTALMVACGLSLALDAPIPAMLAAVSAVITQCVQLGWLRRTRHSVAKACTALESAAQGNLDSRILHIRGHGDIGRMLRNINRVFDLTEVFTKEANAAMAMTAEGRYFRHIMIDGLVGEFADHASTINRAQASMANMSRDFVVEATGVGQTIKHASQSVAVTATQLEATAKQMSMTANRTSNQSEVVAAAAADASVSVDSVAAAAGQVAEAIRDVARRIHQSAEMAQDTVRAATETDIAINSLADAARRIGDVVKLI
ncbi:MAG: sensory rhodopsin II transducer, partial [Magnetospirillum sp.]|nr:sensory rhodopsin II transducer [Magnetospirillum sp.]